MIQLQKPNGYWSKERCIEEAKKYSYARMWELTSKSSYSSATKNGWLEECTAHMISPIKPNGYWSKERCIEEAKKYETITEWRSNCNSYTYASRKGWVGECTKHMTLSKKPRGYWTLELCIEEAKKYKTVSEWQKNSGSSFTTARNNGWYEECKKYFKK